MKLNSFLQCEQDISMLKSLNQFFSLKKLKIKDEKFLFMTEKHLSNYNHLQRGTFLKHSDENKLY